MSAKDTLERHWRAGKQLSRPGWQFREGIQLWHGCWYGCVRWNWQLSEMYLNIEPFISIHYISIRSIKNNYASNFLTRHQKLDPDDRWGLNYFNSDQKRPYRLMLILSTEWCHVDRISENWPVFYHFSFGWNRMGGWDIGWWSGRWSAPVQGWWEVDEMSW